MIEIPNYSRKKKHPVINLILEHVRHNIKATYYINRPKKDYIDARDRESGVSSYDESIRYGSGDKKYNYICPRFWCIRDDKGKGRSLTVKQINDGECGGWDALITNPKAKKVPKGKRIVEFTDKDFI